MYGGTPHLSSSVRRVDYQCPLWGSAWRRPASFRRRSFTTAAAAAPVFLLLILLLIWRCILPRLGARPLQFLGRQLAVMVDIKLVEQGRIVYRESFPDQAARVERTWGRYKQMKLSPRVLTTMERFQKMRAQEVTAARQRLLRS